MNNEDIAFVLSIATLGIGLVHYLTRYIFKSKCEHCSVCYGLIAIDRNVEEERQQDMIRTGTLETV